MPDHFDQNPLGYILSRTYLAFKKTASRAMGSYDITPEQYGILHRLGQQEEGISQKKLAELTVRDQTTTGKIIDKLEHKKLVLRSADPTDRRAVLLYLTPEGRAILSDTDSITQQIHEQATVEISDEELTNFVHVLNKIYRNMSD
ncbi:MAG: MarR family winged helix-turn-helix transcriptional regulator [Candidatus Pristimantibacillus sp.]